jgi:AI-2 transport protein TqsA
MAMGPLNAAGIVLIAVVAVLGALKLASAVVAPAMLALFIIALSWPLQSRLQAKLPRLVALLLTLTAILSAFAFLSSVGTWGFSRVARWTIANAQAFQTTYDRLAGWLEGHGIAVAGILTEHLSAGWILGLIQRLTAHANTTITFSLVVLLYVALGLVEVDAIAARIRSLPKQAFARAILDGCVETAWKWRRFMLVRTLMSVLTGVLVWAFAAALGLPLAREWGVIAFVLNYIPIIGPFFATLLPTLISVVHLESWQGVATVLGCLWSIQLIVGSYVEPRLYGSALTISPSLVLFSIFLWTYLWGLPGTVLGVPIAVAAITFLRIDPRTDWLATLASTASPRADPDHKAERETTEAAGPKVAAPGRTEAQILQKEKANSRRTSDSSYAQELQNPHA